MISVVINVRNGMPGLENALRSVRSWAGEVVVADMHSTDGSREFAVAFGAVVLDVDEMGYVEPARAMAVARASGDWVLIVDADEMIPRALSHKLIEIADGDAVDVVIIPEENWIFGSPLQHSGWQPDVDRHYRFFRRGALEFSDEIHSVPRPVPGSRILSLPYLPDHGIAHFSYDTVSAFVERMNRYTSIEAVTMSHDRNPTIRRDGVIAGGREVYRRYIKGGGWRGDWRGSVLAALMVMYRLLVVLKVQEIRNQRGRDTGAEIAAAIQRLLKEYE